MKQKFIIISLLLLLCVTTPIVAQEGRSVQNVDIVDINNRSTKIPNFGSKNLIIFYVDPDRVGQNDDFVREIKDKTNLKSGKFAGVNIMNIKDAPMAPNAVAYKMAQKRAEASGTPFLIDRDGTLSSTWRLGDCDNLSTIMIINTKGEIKFISKGKITESNKAKFYRVVEGLL